MFLGHPPKVGDARPRGRAGSWLSPCWGLRLRQRQRRISHTRVLLNKLLASTSTRSVSADSARTSLRTVAMRTSQNALVCVVTPLGNRPFGNRPKTAVPVLTPLLTSLVNQSSKRLIPWKHPGNLRLETEVF